MTHQSTAPVSPDVELPRRRGRTIPTWSSSAPVRSACSRCSSWGCSGLKATLIDTLGQARRPVRRSSIPRSRSTTSRPGPRINGQELVDRTDGTGRAVRADVPAGVSGVDRLDRREDGRFACLHLGRRDPCRPGRVRRRGRRLLPRRAGPMVAGIEAFGGPLPCSMRCAGGPDFAGQDVVVFGGRRQRPPDWTLGPAAGRAVDDLWSTRRDSFPGRAPLGGGDARRRGAGAHALRPRRGWRALRRPAAATFRRWQSRARRGEQILGASRVARLLRPQHHARPDRGLGFGPWRPAGRSRSTRSSSRPPPPASSRSATSTGTRAS